MSSRRPRNRRLCPLSESGRSPPISGLRRRHQASRDSNYLLRGRPAHLESGSPHPAGYRQRADGDSSRSGEGPEGSLRHAVTPAAGNPTRLVARGKAPSVALPRRHPGTTHRQECRGTGVSKGPPPLPHPQADYTSQFEARLGSPFAGIGNKSPHHPVAFGPSQPGDYHAIPADGHLQGMLDEQSAGPVTWTHCD